VKIKTIHTSGGNQNFKKARGLDTPNESRWRFQFQVFSLTPRFSAVSGVNMENSRFNGFPASWRGDTLENR
jgi:hypothetical protein